MEPLTRTRALRGPFDYRLAPEHDGVAVGSVLRVTFSGRRTLAVVVELSAESELAPERLAVPDAVLPTAIPLRPRGAGRVARARVLSTPARALVADARPRGGERAGGQVVLTAALTDAGRAALEGEERLDRRAAGAPARAAPTGRRPRRQLGTAALRRLEGRGLVTLERDAPSAGVRRWPASARVGGAAVLTAEQQAALDVVCAGLAGGPERGLLLHGVTGSGKTEVYLRAVAAVLEAGRGAVVLVPEIALTPQTLARFQQRFGDVVAVLHSALSAGERHDEWLALASGQARVCVGPRSAVFAPIPDIGLIVIDEEHDGSYKHEGDPRYDARTVAMHRARQHGAVLLAGSATPRPESAVSLRRLRLPHRVDGQALPPVRVLDMRGSPPSAAPPHAHGAGRRAPLRGQGDRAAQPPRLVELPLLPRLRARVDVPQLRGRARAASRAGRRSPATTAGTASGCPTRCAACGSVAVARHGAGTERLEHELREAIGGQGFPVFRLDADVVAIKDRVARTLSDFGAASERAARRHPDGGQGPRLPRRHARRRARRRPDAALPRLPRRGAHVRARHPAGRPRRRGATAAGSCSCRRSRPTRARSSSPPVTTPTAFSQRELGMRRALGYPPFGTLIRVVCSSAQEGDAMAWPARCATRSRCRPGSVLGPAPLFRLRGRSRSQLVVRTPRATGGDRGGRRRGRGPGRRGLAAGGEPERRRRSAVGARAGGGARWRPGAGPTT